MNEGYVFGDGELYFAKREDLIKHLQTLNWEDCNGNRSQDINDHEDLLEFFYNEDCYYYTEWEDDFQYVMVDGVLTEIE
jgi:hypothetical protein